MNKRLVSIALVALLAITAAAAVGFYEYRAGVARGLEMSGKLPVGPGWAYPYWIGPFHPFGFLFPLLLVILIFALARGLFWWGRFDGREYRHRCPPVNFGDPHHKADEAKP